MVTRSIDAPGSPIANDYSQAMEVSGAIKLLFVSGQIGMEVDGTVPEEFEAQCRLAWKNIKAQLAEAEMGVDKIVKVKTYLSSRKFAKKTAKFVQKF